MKIKLPFWGFCTIILIIALIFICIFTPFPDQKTTVSEGKIFRMNLGTEPPSLDSILVRDGVSITVVNTMMRGLVAYDGYAERIIPECAERWTQSADGKTYTFYLKPNARWSDGQPVKASDFKTAIQRGLNPKNAAPYAFFLFYLKNGKAFYDGKLANFNQVGIHAPNERTVVFHLEQPVAFFINLLAFPTYYPQRQDLISKYGDGFTEAGRNVSNGPYVLKEWRHDDAIILKPNPYYYGQRPHFDRVKLYMISEPNTSLIMYENNELDFVETASSLPSKEVRRLKTRPDYHTLTLHGISYIGFNTQKAPVNKPLFRQALAYALDKTAYPKVFQSGEKPINSWISPGLVGYNSKIGIHYDPKKARQLLAQAGYPDGRNCPKIEFWVAATSAESSQMGEIAQAQWKKNLNIDVTIRRVEWKVFLKQLDNDPPAIFRLQWFVDYPDPDSFMTVFMTGSGNGSIRWSNKTYDNLVKRAGEIQDPRKRKALYDQAQKILLEVDTGIIPLIVIPKNYLLKPHIQHGQRGQSATMSSLNHLSIQ